MRVVTWNVNSVRAREERLLDFLSRWSPEVVCLQETKVLDEAFPHEKIREAGYAAHHLGQRAYNGVAILVKEPLAATDVVFTMDDDVEDDHARLVSATVAGLRIFSAYFPNGGEMGADKWEYKLRWLDRLKVRLEKEIGAGQRVVLCGDYNIAPNADDVSDAETFEGSVLANPEIRGKLAAIADLGLQDTFRPFHPEGRVFSWWDYRARGFERNLGLRIDHVFAPASVAELVTGAVVDVAERRGKGASDHAPVIVELDDVGLAALVDA